MSQQFNRDTQGTEVAEMFPNRVKHKTCEQPHQQRCCVANLWYSVVLCGLTRNELAATTADALAHGDAGAIIFTGCSQAELQPVIDNLNRKHPKVKVIFITADPGHLASVHDAAETIKKLAVPIDGIIGFPTVMAVPWERTDDGIEAHFQRNYLCYFLFVNLLLDSLAPGARVVLVSTSVRQEAPAPKWEDVGFSVSISCLCLHFPYPSLIFSCLHSQMDFVLSRILSDSKNGKNYHPLDGYTQSMFANILFVKSFARRYLGRSIAAFSANPGSE